MAAKKIDVWEAMDRVTMDAFVTVATLDKGTLGDPLQLKANVSSHNRAQGLADFLCNHVNQPVLIIIQPIGTKNLPGIDDEDTETMDMIAEINRRERQENVRARDIVSNDVPEQATETTETPETPQEESVAAEEPAAVVETEEATEIDYNPLEEAAEDVPEEEPVADVVVAETEEVPQRGPLFEEIEEGLFIKRAGKPDAVSLWVKSKSVVAGIGSIDVVDCKTGEVSNIKEGAVNQFYEIAEAPEGWALPGTKAEDEATEPAETKPAPSSRNDYSDLVPGAELHAKNPLVPGRGFYARIVSGPEEKSGKLMFKTDRGSVSLELIRAKYDVVSPTA